MRTTYTCPDFLLACSSTDIALLQALRGTTGKISPGYNAQGLALGLVRQHQQALRVVGAAGHLDFDTLVHVQLELIVEHLLVKRVLQALVGEVDQKLFELVLRIEILEAFSMRYRVGCRAMGRDFHSICRAIVAGRVSAQIGVRVHEAVKPKLTCR